MRRLLAIRLVNLIGDKENNGYPLLNNFRSGFFMLVHEEFYKIDAEDLWIYNKLQLSRLLGHNAGPIGCPVSKEGWYIVRPAINFLGMGRCAFKKWISLDMDPDDYGQPGDFWCEWFDGEHLSVDFYNKEPILTVRGVKKHSSEESEWLRWEKIDKKVDFPSILDKISDKYSQINIEMIGDKIIEVHLRHNPDFKWGNRVAIPVYDIKNQKIPDGYRFVESLDYNRQGFFIDN